MEDKKQFFEIYQKVKKEEMNIKTLDSKTTLKILQMLNEEIKIKMKNVEDNWLRKKNKLEYFIEHDELEKVSSEIYIIKGNIEQEKYEDDISEIENTKFILKHLEDKYKFIFKNLF